MEKLQPRPTATSQPYWDGCAQGELRLQRCAACERFQFYPRLACARCGGANLAWETASGDGVVASVTVARRGLTPAYPPPYVIALIDLAEGPRMMSLIVDADPEAVSIGAPVTVAFAAWSDTLRLPVFRLRAANAAPSAVGNPPAVNNQPRTTAANAAPPSAADAAPPSAADAAPPSAADAAPPSAADAAPPSAANPHSPSNPSED